MSKALESIEQGLYEAIDFIEEKSVEAIIHEVSPVDVKTIREHVGMTQSEFALAFGISLGTLRHWERGDRTPQGPCPCAA
jgi:putative transcriptional regulator